MSSTSAEPVELDPVTQLKIDTAKQKKDVADQAFKAGQLKEGEASRRHIFVLRGIYALSSSSILSRGDISKRYRGWSQ